MRVHTGCGLPARYQMPCDLRNQWPISLQTCATEPDGSLSLVCLPNDSGCSTGIEVLMCILSKRNNSLCAVPDGLACNAGFVRCYLYLVPTDR